MIMNVRKNLFKCAGVRLNVQTFLILGNHSDVFHGVALVNVESAVDENIDDDSQLWSGLNIIVNLEQSVQRFDFCFIESWTFITTITAVCDIVTFPAVWNTLFHIST